MVDTFGANIFQEEKNARFLYKKDKQQAQTDVEPLAFEDTAVGYIGKEYYPSREEQNMYGKPFQIVGIGKASGDGVELGTPTDEKPENK